MGKESIGNNNESVEPIVENEEIKNIQDSITESLDFIEKHFDKTKTTVNDMRKKIISVYEMANEGSVSVETLNGFKKVVDEYLGTLKAGKEFLDKKLEKVGNKTATEEEIRSLTEERDQIETQIGNILKKMNSADVKAQVQLGANPISQMQIELQDLNTKKTALDVQITELEEKREKKVSKMQEKYQQAFGQKISELENTLSSSLGLLVKPEESIDDNISEDLTTAASNSEVGVDNNVTGNNFKNTINGTPSFNLKTTPLTLNTQPTSLGQQTPGQGLNYGLSSLGEKTATEKKQETKPETKTEAIAEQKTLSPALEQMQTAGKKLLNGLSTAQIAKFGIQNIKNQKGEYIPGGNTEKGGLQGIVEMQKTLKVYADGILGNNTQQALDNLSLSENPYVAAPQQEPEALKNPFQIKQAIKAETDLANIDNGSAETGEKAVAEQSETNLRTELSSGSPALAVERISSDYTDSATNQSYPRFQITSIDGGVEDVVLMGNILFPMVRISGGAPHISGPSSIYKIENGKVVPTEARINYIQKRIIESQMGLSKKSWGKIKNVKKGDLVFAKDAYIKEFGSVSAMNSTTNFLQNKTNGISDALRNMQGSSSFDFDDLVKWLDSDKSNDFLSSKYGDEVTLSEYINTLSGTIDKNE